MKCNCCGVVKDLNEYEVFNDDFGCSLVGPLLMVECHCRLIDDSFEYRTALMCRECYGRLDYGCFVIDDCKWDSLSPVIKYRGLPMSVGV